jgi:ribonucleoside-diphosphate reductase alpha chain
MGKKLGRMRHKKLKGETFKIPTGCGKLYITVNENKDGNPVEIIARLGKTGGCASSHTEAIGRLSSIYLKNKGDIRYLIKQLVGITCPNPYTFPAEDRLEVKSCSDAVAQALQEYLIGKGGE